MCTHFTFFDNLNISAIFLKSDSLKLWINLVKRVTLVVHVTTAVGSGVSGTQVCFVMSVGFRAINVFFLLSPI